MSAVKGNRIIVRKRQSLFPSTQQETHHGRNIMSVGREEQSLCGKIHGSTSVALHMTVCISFVLGQVDSEETLEACVGRLLSEGIVIRTIDASEDMNPSYAAYDPCTCLLIRMQYPYKFGTTLSLSLSLTCCLCGDSLISSVAALRHHS